MAKIETLRQRNMAGVHRFDATESDFWQWALDRYEREGDSVKLVADTITQKFGRRCLRLRRVLCIVGGLEVVGTGKHARYTPTMSNTARIDKLTERELELYSIIRDGQRNNNTRRNFSGSWAYVLRILVDAGLVNGNLEGNGWVNLHTIKPSYASAIRATPKVHKSKDPDRDRTMGMIRLPQTPALIPEFEAPTRKGGIVPTNRKIDAPMSESEYQLLNALANQPSRWLRLESCANNSEAYEVLMALGWISGDGTPTRRGVNIHNLMQRA